MSNVNLTFYQAAGNFVDAISDRFVEEIITDQYSSSEFRNTVVTWVRAGNAPWSEVAGADHGGWLADICAEIDRIFAQVSAELSTPTTTTNEKSKPETKTSGLDIYELAKEGLYQNADYYDPHSGYIYHTAQYNRAKRFGLPDFGIGVTDSTTGQFLGYAQR